MRRRPEREEPASGFLGGQCAAVGVEQLHEAVGGVQGELQDVRSVCERMFVARPKRRAARGRPSNEKRGGAPYSRTDVFSELPAVNFGTRAAGMWTFWLGLRGFTPSRAARCEVENLPKP